MHTIIMVDDTECDIPGSVRDLKSFRRWARSDEFPEKGRYSWLNGLLWVDRQMEELFTHNLLKTRFSTVLSLLTEAEETGYFLSDGMFLTNVAAGLSTEPDGMFLSFGAIEEGRVRLVRTRRGIMEVEGSPDMALEVVSFSSAGKDRTKLRELYHRAGVREYWLVDVRHHLTQIIRRPSPSRPPVVRFDILVHTPDGYVALEKPGGWVRSDVFDRSFRLRKGTDRLGNPQFTLDIRD